MHKLYHQIINHCLIKCRLMLSRTVFCKDQPQFLSMKSIRTLSAFKNKLWWIIGLSKSLVGQLLLSITTTLIFTRQILTMSINKYRSFLKLTQAQYLGWSPPRAPWEYSHIKFCKLIRSRPGFDKSPTPRRTPTTPIWMPRWTLQNKPRSVRAWPGKVVLLKINHDSLHQR